MTETELLNQLDELLALPAETEWVEFKYEKRNCDLNEVIGFKSSSRGNIK